MFVPTCICNACMHESVHVHVYSVHISAVTSMQNRNIKIIFNFAAKSSTRVTVLLEYLVSSIIRQATLYKFF